jgi:hypothetical protein
MARYFFNIIEGQSKTLLRDSQGAEFPSLDEARKEAIGLARDIVRHKYPTQTCRIVVSNQNGDEVLDVFLSEIRARKIRDWFDLAARIAKLEPGLGTRPLVWVVAAALLGIFAQTAVTILVREESGGGYQTASAPIEDSVVAVRFVPHASAADINRFLDDYNATIVDGPRAGGFYRVRIGNAIVPQEELKKIVAGMAQEKVVEFAATAQ